MILFFDSRQLVAIVSELKVANQRLADLAAETKRVADALETQPPEPQVTGVEWHTESPTQE